MLTEDDVRRIIHEEMGSSVNWAPEFKSSLPAYMEISGMTLPISQITGTYVVADTVAGLGAGVHGRTGVIRGGATPFDFLNVTYDAEYGKWVSDAFPAITQGDAGFLSVSTNYEDVVNSNDFLVPWESLDVAGMAPQFRLFGGLDNTNVSGVTTATMNFVSVDANGTLGSDTNASWTITNTGTTASLEDSGWQDIPSLTVRDYLFAEIVVKTGNAAHVALAGNLTAHIRWVSK